MKSEAEAREFLNKSRRVLVWGLSRSGLAAAKVLLALGKEVVTCDAKPVSQLRGVEQILASGAEFLPEQELACRCEDFDLVIKSPGISNSHPLYSLLETAGIPVWSELELGFLVLDRPFLAVTGTNGKTTTTALLGHLLRSARRQVWVAGNIGHAVCALFGQLEGEGEVVCEVSSFQLENIVTFRPKVAVFLNLTPDHLDRHPSMEHYFDSKARMFLNQGPGDAAVLNLQDAYARMLGDQLLSRDDGPEVFFFSTAGPDQIPLPSGRVVEPDSYLVDNTLVICGKQVVRVQELQLRGTHNFENCLAAGTAAFIRGVSSSDLKRGLATFGGVAHRLEKAGNVGGVEYINDSKATNVDAALKALDAYPERVHLILGGRDKAGDFAPLVRACVGRCQGVYLIGEAAPVIAKVFGQELGIRAREVDGAKAVDEDMPSPPVFLCGDLQTAVRVASQRAIPGDVVLLAPACASFDQYENYEARGDHFRALVRELARERREELKP